MLGSFKKSFKKQRKTNPSHAVVSAIEKDIPDNFMLRYDEENGLILIPKTGETISGSVTFSDEAMQKLKDVPKDKWYTYLYRTQQPIEVKNVTVGDADNKVPLALVGQNPLRDIKIQNIMMYPQPFSEPFIILCDTLERDHLEIKMKQVPYDSWIESKFENVDHKGIRIEIYINDEDIRKSRITYSISPQNAKTVGEAVAIVHLFKGLLEGTAKINGSKAIPIKENPDVDRDRLNDMSFFWEDALKLEEKIGVTFDPAADYPEEDVKFFTELVECLINRKSLSWRRPFESFHVGGFSSREELEKTVDKPGLKYSFLEGPVPCTLLGAEFELYAYCELKDFKVTKIEWDDNNGAEIFVDDALDRDWTMIRFFLTPDEKQKIETLMNTKKPVSLPEDLDK